MYTVQYCSCANELASTWLTEKTKEYSVEVHIRHLVKHIQGACNKGSLSDRTIGGRVINQRHCVTERRHVHSSVTITSCSNWLATHLWVDGLVSYGVSPVQQIQVQAFLVSLPLGLFHLKLGYWWVWRVFIMMILMMYSLAVFHPKLGYWRAW